MRHVRKDGKRPEWLIGLIIAVVITLIGFIVLRAIGAGDDPTFSGALVTLI